ncbi:polymorphic toxin-type HINT domain-containing protein [Nonomuraea sp. NPDC049504]|uniref:polymorphic toxin-type HINT domain-containing protein n=1 Tax=Nonomuraea sp. NPDC049504 TaxID=3154729 RepID=UPI00341E4F97
MAARRRMAIVTLSVLALAGLPAMTTPSYADRWEPPEPQRDLIVASEPIPVGERPSDLADKSALKEPPEVVWPRPATMDTAPARTGAALSQVSGMPVRVGPAEDGTAPARVRVELLDRPGEDPLVPLRVTRSDGGPTGAPLTLEFDYSAFRHAYGGDWAARLRLAELPACGLAQGAADCPAPTPLETANDVTAGTLRAEVSAAPAGSGGGLYAVLAAPSGSTGTFTASSLSPTAKWQVSTQTGDFAWSYPLRTPPSLGGPTPQLALSYSSGGVDGRTVSTNNQPGWAGEGFDFTPGGFVERRYKSCNDDGVTPKNGEQCWGGDNAVLMLGGRSTELVRDSKTGTWKPKLDDGSRVQKLTGATNGDNDGEHWKITTAEGMQYFFGVNRLPGWTSGKRETKSAWTMPVYGDDDKEPCHASTYEGSWCQQAYRWNLDHVIDTHGNTLSYFYAQEINHYGRNVEKADETPYVAGGHLERIEYGQRAGQVYTTQATARVNAHVAERCLPTSSFDCAPDKLTAGNAKHWPDVPADQICLAGEDCENYSPTFFTRKRLAKVTTQVLDGGAYKDVDSWTLTHTFPKPGDGMSAALWLAKIQHTGHVGGTQSMPAVDFDGVEMPNRVDGREGIAPMMKWRVLSVNNESGGRLTVNYSKPECARGATPQPHANTKRCFPTHWAPEGASDPYLDWFHKYVAVQVLESDLTGGSVTVRSDYAYPPDGAAWAYDDQELVPAERRTWSQWRGYERVQVTRGEDPDRRIATEHLFFRGLHGDKQPTGTRTAYVTDSQGTRVQDHWRLQGFERETRYLLGPGGQEQSGTINDPWLSGPTAEGGGDEAYLLDTAKVRSRAKLSTGGLRLMETRRSYDSTGAVTQVEDLGDTGTAADDQCTRYTYARNTSAWILHLPSRIETVAVTCSQTPRRPDDVVGDARMSYDGGAYGAAPAKGDQTQVEELDHYADGQPVYVPVSRTAYDQYGRLTESVDATGRKTGTAYTPATGGPVTSVATTNPLGHVTTTWLKPEWGAMTAEEDPNGRRTELAYDPLGRLAKVWLPGRASSQSPSGEFSYQVRTDGPVVVTTRTLRPDGGHTVGHELYDGLMRLRQTQLPGHGGDWLLGDTVYNTLGQVAKKNDLYASTGPPATAILGVADSAVPAQTVYEYDAMGRQSAEALMVLGQEKWRTTTTHFPDRVDMDPPAGATPMTSLLDAQGRTVELRQYKGQSPTGDYDATRYTYDRNGLEASVTDAQGSVWRTHYDLRNRVTKLEDPDRGTTTFGYDVLGRTTSTTDARGRTLAFVYDRLDRQVATHEGSPSGAKLTEWTYDTLPDGTSVKGMPVSSVRHSGGQSYVTRVDAYDERYRPTSITQVIPSSEGGLAGSYTVEPRYNDDGTVRSVKYPAAGDLPEETVRTTYTALGLPVQTRSSLATYVNDTLYSRHGEQLQVRWGAEGSQVLHDYTYEVGTRRLLRHIVDRETAGQVRQADVRYSYDPAGNITGIADTPPVANAASDVQCFTYDYLRRLTGAWSATDGCAAPPGLAVVGGPAPYWHSYTYDRSGNRLTETRHAAGGGTTSTYTYPEATQPQPHGLRQVTTTGPDGGRLDSYAYDASGNTILRKLGSAEQRLEWDTEGNLAKIVEAGGTTSFLYDADGNRLIRRDPAGTTLYLAGMEVRLAKNATSPTATRFYAHGDEPVAVRTGRALTWVVGDHNGTGRLAIDAETLEVTRRHFDPFGNPRGTAPTSWPSERGFIGGTSDPTGLTHIGAREYDASIGRFVSVDPLLEPDDPQNLNGYAYSDNSPVTYTDPSGRADLCGHNPGDCQDGPPGGGQGGGSGSGSGGSTPPPPPPPGGPSQKDQDEAKKTINKSWTDVAIEAGGEIIKDLIGYTDVRDCLQGNLGSCAMAIAGLVPAVKIGKALKAAYKAARAVLRWRERLKWARRVQGEAEEAAEALAKYQDDLAKWKKAQEASKATKRPPAGGAAGDGKNRLVPGGDIVKLPPTRGRGGTCPTRNSFVPGTTVLMADGSRVPIEQVRPGDEVVATDPRTGETSTRTVTATIVGDGAKHLVDVSVDTGGETGRVTATDGHPFWVDSRGQWVDAADLRVGDTVRTPEGRSLAITALRAYTERQRVHNLTVDGVHTYYVAAADDHVLVHNCWRGGHEGKHRFVRGKHRDPDGARSKNRAYKGRHHEPPIPLATRISVKVTYEILYGQPSKYGRDPNREAQGLADRVNNAKDWMEILVDIFNSIRW